MLYTNFGSTRTTASKGQHQSCSAPHEYFMGLERSGNPDVGLSWRKRYFHAVLLCCSGGAAWEWRFRWEGVRIGIP